MQPTTPLQHTEPPNFDDEEWMLCRSTQYLEEARFIIEKLEAVEIFARFSKTTGIRLFASETGDSFQIYVRPKNLRDAEMVLRKIKFRPTVD